MIQLKRTDSENRDFVELVRLLDHDLAQRNGDLNDYYAQFNKIDLIKNAIVAYQDNEPVGCGAFKSFDKDSVEIKRMFVKPSARGNGIASLVLKELEQWAFELDHHFCVLETGTMNPEALSLYLKKGYTKIPNFGPYQGVVTSICMSKKI